MWPTFVAITLLDALILHLLPPTRTGVDLIPALLLATFGNLIVIGALAAQFLAALRAKLEG